MSEAVQFSPVEELVEALKAGEMIVLVDDEDRENEGDLVMLSEFVQPEHINFMAKYARGLICMTLTQEHADQIGLQAMVQQNNAHLSTNFMVSIEAAEGVTTGISAADRAKTVQAAVAPNAKPSDIVQPGHVFPIVAQPGGVLRRAGHTEAGCDLAKLAGAKVASSVIVEIMNDDGTMARRSDLELFVKEHNLKMGTIADLIHYRNVNDQTVELVSEQLVKSSNGEFKMMVFKDTIDQSEHVALIKGDLEADAAPLVRVHIADPLRDMLQLESEQPAWQVPDVLEYISKSDKAGVLILLGESFVQKRITSLMGRYIVSDDAEVKAGKEETKSAMSTAETYRMVGTGSQILQSLGVHKMTLLNQPIRFNAISGFDLEIVEFVSPR